MNLAKRFLLGALASKAYKRAAPGEKFQLSSGLTSSVVLDASLAIRDSRAFHELSLIIRDMLADVREFDVVAGPSSGADPMCAATLRHREVRWCSVRRTKKNHGFDSGLVTGPIKEGDRVVMMEDVVTTGRSLLRACEAVQAVGCVVIGTIVLVDREEFDGRKSVQDFLGPNAFFRSALTLSEIEMFGADQA